MDLTKIGLSGLNAYQRALGVTGQNITNVNTPSYSRETIDFQTNPAAAMNPGYQSTGVSAGNVTRKADTLLTTQLNEGVSSYNHQVTIYNTISQIDTMLSNSQTSVNTGISNFFDALHTANNNPSGIVGRTALINQSNNLTSIFHQFYNQLNDQNTALNQNIVSVSSEINKVATNIATLNQSISLNVNNPNPNLLDQRDALLSQLAGHVGFTTSTQQDGSMNVYIGSGQTLVVGGTARQLTTVPGLSDPASLDIAMVSGNGVLRLDNTAITGGKLGGYFSLRTGIIKPAIRNLDRIAMGVASSINTQHKLGMDLYGQLGGNYFNDINSSAAQLNRSAGNSTNTGNAALGVSIDNVSALTADVYQLTYNGVGSYTLVNTTQNTSTNVASLPTSIDGFTINLSSGAFASGDSYTITPTSYGSRDLNVNVANPSSIALASPIKTGASSTNAGSGAITDGVVNDTTNAAFTTTNQQLSPPVTIRFLTATTYEVLNTTTGLAIQAGPVSYNPSISNAIFPVPAVEAGTASALTNAGSLTPLAGGNLTINGTAIAAAASDGVSTSDASASAKAIATAINASSLTTGVTAAVNPNTVDLGTFTTGALAGGEFQINGQNIVNATGTQSDLLLAINTLSTTTGVTAVADASHHIILTAADGRNIQITTSGGVAAATFSGFSLAGGALDNVQQSSVILTSSSNFTIAGGAPGNAGLTAATYSIYDPGYTVSMSGAPVSGDLFNIAYNTNGYSDSRNGLNLSGIQTQNIFNNGLSTMSGAYGSLVADVGNSAHQSDLLQKSLNSLLTQLQDQRNSISGVNLDEEAGNLVTYQQAYEASAKVVSMAQQLFQALFNAIGR